MNGREHAARVTVEAVLSPVVADLPNRFSRNLWIIHMGVSSDFSGDDYEASGQKRLTRDP